MRFRVGDKIGCKQWESEPTPEYYVGTVVKSFGNGFLLDLYNPDSGQWFREYDYNDHPSYGWYLIEAKITTHLPEYL